LIQTQPRKDLLIPLDQFGGGKAPRKAGFLRVVLDQVRRGVQAAMNGPGGTEIQHLRQPVLAHGLHHLLGQLRHALGLDGADGHDRDAQRLGEPLHIHGSAVDAHLVHHVERHDHGQAQFQQLQRQIEVAFEIGGVHDVENPVGMAVQQKIPRDGLLLRVRPEGINPREVDNQDVFIPLYASRFLVHGHAGKVPHMLAGTCQNIEQRGFAAVWVSG